MPVNATRQERTASRGASCCEHIFVPAARRQQGLAAEAARQVARRLRCCRRARQLAAQRREHASVAHGTQRRACRPDSPPPCAAKQHAIAERRGERRAPAVPRPARRALQLPARASRARHKSASRSTTAPRAVLTSTPVGFNSARRRRSMSPRVSGVRLQCSVTTSDSRSSVSRPCAPRRDARTWRNRRTDRPRARERATVSADPRRARPRGQARRCRS